MPTRLKDVATSSFASQTLRTPIILVPPNSATLYVASTAGNSLVKDALMTMAVLTWGGPSTLHLISAGTLGSGKSVTFKVIGRNRNYDQVSELLTVTGDGVTATWNIVSVNLYREVTSIQVQNITGTLLVGETFSFGSGNGTSTPAIRIPAPFKGITLAQFPGIYLTGANIPGAAFIACQGFNAAGDQAVFNYASTSQVRTAMPVLVGVDRSAVDRS